MLKRACACGICRTDATFVQMGSMPHDPAGLIRQTAIGREPIREIAASGADAIGPKIDDRVIIRPQAAPREVTGCSGTYGGAAVCAFTEHGRRLAEPVGHWSRITEVHDANQLALTPGAAKKAVVTFGH